MLAAYDFLAGRLVPSLEDSSCFETECNGSGVVVAAPKTDTKLDELGELLVPKKEFRQFVAFLPREDEEMDLKDKPLVSFQVCSFHHFITQISPDQSLAVKNKQKSQIDHGMYVCCDSSLSLDVEA